MTKSVLQGREGWGDLYRAGQTMQEIADANGVSVSTVYNVLRSQGIRSRIGSNSHIEYERMYRQGHSLVEVANRFGVTKQAVQQSLKAWGIRRRGHDGLPRLTKESHRRP